MTEGLKFLYTAYALAGLIYALYGGHLAWRLRRARQELSELKDRAQAARSSDSTRA
ncbi:MAG: hypothetical protein ACE145_10875 [Terriglobia bacterium]